MQLAAQTMGSRLKLISSIGNGGFLEKHAKCLPAFSARIGPLFFFPSFDFLPKDIGQCTAPGTPGYNGSLSATLRTCLTKPQTSSGSCLGQRETCQASAGSLHQASKAKSCLQNNLLYISVVAGCLAVCYNSSFALFALPLFAASQTAGVPTSIL